MLQFNLYYQLIIISNFQALFVKCQIDNQVELLKNHMLLETNEQLHMSQTVLLFLSQKSLQSWLKNWGFISHSTNYDQISNQIKQIKLGKVCGRGI